MGAKLQWSGLTKWEADGEKYGWTMPYFSRWQRLPIIRHVLAIQARFAVAWWYAFGPGQIGIPTGFDAWVIRGIWNGWSSRP